MLAILIGTSSMPAIAADGVGVLVMPMEHERTGADSFTSKDYRAQYPNIEIDNETEDEWDDLRIGSHSWFCGELQKIAKAAGETIHIRFLSWGHAYEDLAVTYAKTYDVCQVPSSWTAALIDLSVLSEYQDFDTDIFPDKLVETCRVDGSEMYHAVPWHVDFRLLFYSTRLTQDPDQLVDFDSFRECLKDR